MGDCPGLLDSWVSARSDNTRLCQVAGCTPARGRFQGAGWCGHRRGAAGARSGVGKKAQEGIGDGLKGRPGWRTQRQCQGLRAVQGLRSAGSDQNPRRLRRRAQHAREGCRSPTPVRAAEPGRGASGIRGSCGRCRGLRWRRSGAGSIRSGGSGGRRSRTRAGVIRPTGGGGGFHRAVRWRAGRLRGTPRREPGCAVRERPSSRLRGVLAEPCRWTFERRINLVPSSPAPQPAPPPEKPDHEAGDARHDREHHEVGAAPVCSSGMYSKFMP